MGMYIKPILFETGFRLNQPKAKVTNYYYGFSQHTMLINSEKSSKWQILIKID